MKIRHARCYPHRSALAMRAPWSSLARTRTYAGRARLIGIDTTDVEHRPRAPPDRHVATQIATWPQDLTCIQKKNARNTYYTQDMTDSERPQTLRAPRSPRGHPDRHVATRFNMYSEEKCAQHILRAG